MQAVPSFHFDTDLLPPAERFSAWTASLPHYVLGLPDNAPAEGFSAVATGWLLGEVIVHRARLPAIEWLRPAARAGADGVNTFNFLLLLNGTFVGASNSRSIVVGPGQIACFDLAQPYEGRSDPCDCISVTVARPLIETSLRRHADLHGRTFEGASAMLLVDYVVALARHLPMMSKGDTPAIQRATISQFLAAITAAEGRAEATGPSGFLQRARAEIEKQLASDLSPSALAQRLGVTRSALYRAFEPLGGVSAYIRRRRLEAVRTLLTDPRETRPLAELAATFGFSSASHLSNGFRQAFGASPGTVRRNAASAVQAEEGLHLPVRTFLQWTKRLQGRSH